jgi:hypothetical protein
MSPRLLAEGREGIRGIMVAMEKHKILDYYWGSAAERDE